MDAINNVDQLKTIFERENPRWQEIIFEKTGVVLLLKDKSGTLFSRCGFIDLDYEAEYCYDHGIDKTSYCEITHIDEIIEYILNMESYASVLTDIPVSLFSKADLFWAAHDQIVWAEANKKRPDGSNIQDWELFSISKYLNHTEMHMALIEYDSTDIWLDLPDDISLDEALNMLVKEMNEVTHDISRIPEYRVISSNRVANPKTYNDLMNRINEGFNWLL